MSHPLCDSRWVMGLILNLCNFSGYFSLLWRHRLVETFVDGYWYQWYVIIGCIFIYQKIERRDIGVETDDEPMDSDDVSEKRLPTFSDYFIIYPTRAGKTVRFGDSEKHIHPFKKILSVLYKLSYIRRNFH